MKITLIHGQNHKGSTYHIARMTAEKISSNMDEFFLPKDCGEGCTGCLACLHQGREFCPFSEKVKVIFDSMRSSDVIISGEERSFLKVHNPKLETTTEGEPIKMRTIASKIIYYTAKQDVFM